MRFRINGRGVLSMTGLLFLFLASGLLQGQEHFTLPGTGSPGEVLIITLPKEALPLHSLSLLDEDGILRKRVPFFVFQGRRTALLPLDSTIEAGTYLIQGCDGNGNSCYKRDFFVQEREFRRDVIALNQKLGSLRTEQNEVQRNEALEIQAIYAECNREALYDSLNFISPIDFAGLDYFRVSSEYGDRRIFQYNNDRTSRAVHTGIDLATREGVPVGAAAAGRVVLAKHRIISGHSVVIEHLPGVYSIYFHLEEINVEPGQMIGRGERIGSVGMSGLATGPHLHWEIRVNGTAVDPRQLTETEIIDTIKGTVDR